MKLTQYRGVTSLWMAGLVFLAGVASPNTVRAELPVSQLPLHISAAQDAAPLNMLVMGKDHKNYYEAYNDASDLNGDGQLDVGYKPDDIEYYGYFNSSVCYVWNAGGSRFDPAASAGGSNGKQCSGSGHWSGDFLNYLTTGRLDALRKVLYGGWRQVDSATQTVLQGAFFPQDAHSWGKEYQSINRDGFDISQYAPLGQPDQGNYHLFAVTTLADNTAPLLRVLENSPFRVWNWVSIEGPVADNTCFTAGGEATACIGTQSPPGNPASRSAFDALESNYAIAANQLGGDVVRNTINCNSNDCNPNGSDDHYMSIAVGAFRIADSNQAAGTFEFEIRGDDAIDFELRTNTNWGNSAGRVARTGCYNGRGFNDACTGSGENVGFTVTASLARNTTYHFKFRHMEGTGGDGYRLRWRKESGNRAFDWAVFDASSNHNNNVDAASNARIRPTFRFYNLTPSSGGGRSDYAVRVLACPSTAAWREANCKSYGSGGNTVYKPTGILHDFGESERMYFGLLTGSQMNNTEGGVLRRNLSSFADEINPATGQFLTNVNGIARTLDSFRMIGGGYGDKTRTRDHGGNWDWNRGTGNCPSFGDRALNNGECRMWGNPIGEMMFETLRYYAGAEAATPGYISLTGNNGVVAGAGEETTLGLSREEWKDPYKPAAEGGLGFLSCSKPVMTVISDINPSYDSSVPGNAWNNSSFDLPASISDFEMQTLGQRMWNSEFGAGSRSAFIGQVGAGATDGAPTAKSVSSFGNIRGLSPEEPSKEGSFSSSLVSFYSWTKDGGINELSNENIRTYSVALASPLPRIEFPINGQTVTLVPFAKTASGTFGMGSRKPTNTIVDFYVQEYNNFPGQEVDASVNEGRPKAVFRINYEDVEQGNDHDMDAIVRYEVTANANNTVEVKLTSEYAAGSANQVMGYVISGTTNDGVYLEVRDVDSPTCRRIDNATCSGGYMPYALNTPPGRDPGFCVDNTSNECGLLPTVATRVFTPDTGASGVVTLRDPLWYAAKYGGFNDLDGNGLPNTPAEWDEDGDGNPDNYFLVTNALSLKEALEKAFNKILADSRSSGGTAASGSRHNDGFLAYVPEYDTRDWTGDIKAYRVNRSNGSLVLPPVWSVAGKLATVDADDRDIYFVDKSGGTGSGTLREFQSSNLGADADVQAAALGFNPPSAAGDMDEVVAYLRGDQSLEVSDPNNGTGRFRKRGSRLGDILGSQPTILATGSYGYSMLPLDEGGGYNADGTLAEGGYVKFVEWKKERTPVAFVGANDGMLHAINASNTEGGGEELFAIIPNSVMRNLHLLTDTNYAASHRYFVDGSPEQGDAFLGGEWKTVVLAPMGAGGSSILALDATNPAEDGAVLMWEFEHPDLGLTIGRPRIARWNGEWVAIFGNGYNAAGSDDSSRNQAFLFIVDLETGELMHRIQLGDQGTEAVPNGLATTFPVDLDRDSDVDLVYAGDYYGNLWRISLKDYGVTDALDAVRLYEGELGEDGLPTLPITGGVNATYHPARGQMVLFGTGKYFLEGDNAAATDSDPVNAFFGVWDDPLADSGTYPLEKSDLQMQSFVEENGVRTVTGGPVNWNGAGGEAKQFGWYINLPDPGERFVGIPEVSLGRVIFTSFIAEGDECAPGGYNWLNVLSTTSGMGVIGTGRGGGDGVGSIMLPSDGGGGPAPTPPTVTLPPESACDPATDPDCEAPEPPAEECDPSDEDCTPDCDPDTGECGTIDFSARGCETRVGVLTHLGIIDFDSFSCGRQSWKQFH